MHISSTKFLNHTKNGFVVIIYIFRKFNKIVRYIVIIIRNTSIKIATLLALVLAASLISCSRTAAAYQVSPTSSSYGVEATISICETNQGIFDEKSQSAIQISKINYNSEINYNKNITLEYPLQNTNTKNLVYNLSKKRSLSQILLLENSALKTTKSENLCVLHLVNLKLSQKILSAFYSSFNNKTILSLQLMSCFISQNQVFLQIKNRLSLQLLSRLNLRLSLRLSLRLISRFANKNRNSCDEREREERKSITMTHSIFAYFYKINDQVFLTRDIKEYGLYTGNIGRITSIIDNTNKISVLFELKQPLSSVQFRNQLNKLVTMFVPFSQISTKGLAK